MERALKEVDGVLLADVHLATRQATVEFDSQRAQLAELVAAVRGAGYDVAVEKAALPIGGLTRVSDLEQVEEALKSVDGVLSANVDLVTKKAAIEYLPQITGLSDFEQAVVNAGYGIPKAKLEEKGERLQERAFLGGRIHLGLGIAVLVLSLVLVLDVLGVVELTVVKRSTNEPGVPTMYLAQPASAEEMFSEFICPCCGKPIGECSCGMAEERKKFVTEQVSAGKNELEIYLAYADRYGLDTFASQHVRGEIREYILANAPEERPQIVLEPQEIDLGNVSQKRGKVETTMMIKNTGQKDLIVEGLSTSCACTTASVVNNGQEGPIFGADTPPGGWSTTIRPGEAAELRIYYDPNFHKDARGSMVREVYISSNDPVDPVIKARIKLNQVD
ncbi:MAG: cation transporter [Anaerolineae bacterium]